MNKPIEEAQIREVSEEKPLEEGESVVRLQKSRRKWLWLLPITLLLFFLLLLLRSSEQEEGVSLSAAREVIIKEKPAWDKSAMLRVLRKEGFRATPGPPKSPLQVTVSLRRDGFLLRSQSDRVWVLRDKLSQGQ